MKIDLSVLLGGVGQAAKDIRQAIKNDLPADKRAEIEIKLAEFESRAMSAQVELNKIEAESPNLFKSGWRPCIGWICATALGLYFLVFPTLETVWPQVGLPEYDMGTLMPLVLSLLGIGGLRTYEKTKGVK